MNYIITIIKEEKLLVDELLKALPSLLGVIVGGLFTFFIQQSIIREQQK